MHIKDVDTLTKAIHDITDSLPEYSDFPVLFGTFTTVSYEEEINLDAKQVRHAKRNIIGSIRELVKQVTPEVMTENTRLKDSPETKLIGTEWKYNRKLLRKYSDIFKNCTWMIRSEIKDLAVGVSHQVSSLKDVHLFIIYADKEEGRISGVEILNLQDSLKNIMESGKAVSL